MVTFNKALLIMQHFHMVSVLFCVESFGTYLIFKEDIYCVTSSFMNYLPHKVWRPQDHVNMMTNVRFACVALSTNRMGKSVKLKQNEISSPSSIGYIQSVGFLSGCLFLQNNDINAQ